MKILLLTFPRRYLDAYENNNATARMLAGAAMACHKVVMVADADAPPSVTGCHQIAAPVPAGRECYNRSIDLCQTQGIFTPMLTQNHAATAQEFLEVSDREFAAGDHLQASEKLWGAATHAVMAVAQQREWPHRSHCSLKNAVGRLASEAEDPAVRDAIAGGFAAAEKFHKNFYHDEMEDFEIEHDRPQVHRFVARILTLLNN